MKGVIFTEFIEVVEENFGYEMINLIIDKVQDPEEGAYTSVKDYSHLNLVNLVVALHEETKIPLSEVLIFFGTHLFPKLAKRHPQIIKDFDNSFDLLEKIEDVIHVEVKKLYPAAMPPKFVTDRISEVELLMIYSTIEVWRMLLKV